MNGLPKIFNDLVESLTCFPGIGRRSAERMAFHILKMPAEEVKALTNNIEEIRQSIKPCAICNNFSTEEVCSICKDSRREKDTICIVEESKDILAIEKTSHYKGIYYVLLGVVSPLEGVLGDDLNISKLINRLSQGEIKEVIISTNPDNDGELTARFLVEKISHFKVKIYRLAIGIPLGTQIEYIDTSTLGKALLERRQLVV